MTERLLTVDNDHTRDMVSQLSKYGEVGRLSLAPAVDQTSRPKSKYLENVSSMVNR